MTKEHEIIINSLSDYINKIEELKEKSENDKSKTDLLFRGQRKDQTLLPKLARLSLNGNIESVEKLMLEEFRRACVPLAEYQPEDNWDLLALAQHHGLPTRLLDWTYSALVALWFSVYKEPEENKSGVVWVLSPNISDFRSKEQQENPLSNEITKIFRPRVVSKRISAQSGAFTVHKINDGGKIVKFENHLKFKNNLTKLKISPENFSKIRKSLNIMGINHSTVFPDMDGLCQHLERRFSKLMDE